MNENVGRPGLWRVLVRRLVPRRLRERLRAWHGQVRAWPPIGRVEFGDLRRTSPVSRVFGMDRGQPIDRYYIDDFMRRYAWARDSIRGRVLEVDTPVYAERFGNPAEIERIDVLDVSSDNPRATLIADLADAPNIPSQAFDCVICTHTLLLIYDVTGAVHTIHRILKPGGTALVTLPGVCQSPQPDRSVFGDYWRFTSLTARRMLEEAFRPEEVEVKAYGNVLAASALLYGLSVADLSEAELEVRDPDYEVIIGIKAIKGCAPPPASRGGAG